MLSAELQIFLLAMTPVGELRAAIPFGLGWHQLPWLQVLLIAIMGNLLPVTVLLLGLKSCSQWMIKRSRFADRFFHWLFDYTCRRHRLEIEQYGWWGLMFFVAIPLPMTGGWSGAMVAFLTGMPFWRAFSAISCGVIGAGIMVTGLVSAGLASESLLGWQALTVLVLFLGGVWAINRRFKCRKKNYG